MTDDVGATVQKNWLEEIRVCFSNFNGHRLLNVRARLEGDDGPMRPSKAGLALKADKLPDFASAVSHALETAREKGLIQ